MVDFNKKIYNTDKFRESAIFFKEHGTYTLAPRGTSDYIRFWDTETKRCINGYVAPDGDPITGYHYFYLNYFPIMRLKEVQYTDKFGNVRKRRERLFEFPDFYDYDYFYFNAIDEAEISGKHMAVLKARQKGFSFKGAAMLVRNYELIPGSKNFAVASEQKYLVGDGLLTKAWQGMDFIDKNTAWAKQRLKSTVLERTSGFKIKDEYGKETESGYLSSITGITLKNDIERIRGTRGRLFLFEEAGKFKDIKQAWAVTQPSVETDDGKAFGLMCAFGTGGTEGSDFEGLKSMFYNPEGFNILPFDNIWDEKSDNTKCAFFVPSWANIDALDKDGNRIYMDKDGNSYRDKGIELQIQQRKKVQEGQSDQTFTDRFISERPICPQEAVLEIGGNIFPKKLLLQQLSKIRTNEKIKNMKHVVDLSWDGNGMVTATEKKQGDITQYPLPKDNKPDGSIVIWEYPIQDPPFGLYIGGCLTPGQKVCTQRGLINVEDVTLSDKLINKDGKFVTIKNLQQYYKEQESIYKMRVSNTYRTTTFTGEHPIYVTDQLFGDCNFIHIKDVKVGQYVKIPNIYQHTNQYIDTPIKSQDFWWFIGLWLGDGWCDKHSHSISISFDEKQSCFYNRYYQFLNDNNIKYHSRTRNNSIEVTFCSKQIQEWLTCTFGEYSYGKHIPDRIKRINNECKSSLIHGYLDSDGCVCTDKLNRNTIEFVSINQGLLEDVQDLCFALQSCGGITKMRSAKQIYILGRCTNQKDCYHLRFGHKESIKLYNWLVQNTKFNDEKLDKINYNLNLTNHNKHDCVCDGDYIYIKIKEIEQSLYTGIVYNFECNTHTYMSRNIVTHNCDPYDHDDSFTNSLGSMFVYKRFKVGEAWNDVLVAEYSGRPSTAEEYYENARKLLIFYNARLLFENERKGIYPYFTNKQCDYLLADQPDKVISEIFKDSKVQRRKGCHMAKQIRQYAEGLIKEWLEEEYEPGHPNVERIYSEPLLEELLMNNGIRNVDRVIALCMTMIYREELYQVKVSESKEKNKQVELFEMPLFSQKWWNSEEVQDDTPVFTF